MNPMVTINNLCHNNLRHFVAWTKDKAGRKYNSLQTLVPNRYQLTKTNLHVDRKVVCCSKNNTHEIIKDSSPHGSRAMLPLGISRSPAVQTYELKLAEVTLVVRVETEAPAANIRMVTDGEVDREVTMWAGETIATTCASNSIIFTLETNGLKAILQGTNSYAGWLIRWPEQWPAAAQVLLATDVFSTRLEAGSKPCGYISGVGMAMSSILNRGSVLDWHAHEGTVYLIKYTPATYVYQIQGCVQGVRYKGAAPYEYRCCAHGPEATWDGLVTTVALGQGQVAVLPPGRMHRAVAPMEYGGYKLVYTLPPDSSQGVGAFIRPTPDLTRIEVPKETTTLPAVFRVGTKEASFGHVPLWRNTPPDETFVLTYGTRTGLMESIATDALTLSTAACYGLLGEFSPDTADVAILHKALKICIVSVAQGAINLKVEGTIFNTIDDAGYAVHTPTSHYNEDMPKYKKEHGFSVVRLKAPRMFMLHPGAIFSISDTQEETTKALCIVASERTNNKDSMRIWTPVMAGTTAGNKVA